MSNNEATVSDEEHAELRSDSVFDFLYCDSRRIASFLAQFDDSGHLERVVQKESATRNIKRGFDFSVGGGLNLLGQGGSGNIGIKRGPSDEGTEASERTYDPLWTNALTFMDFADDRGLIHRDISAARIGQIVMIKGHVALFDFSLLRKAWDLPAVRRALTGQQANTEANKGENRHFKRRSAALGQQHKQVAPTEMEMAIDLMTIVPHLVQSSVNNEHVAAWSTLREEWMTIPPADLLLKHGASVPGEWGLIGVLDALPDDPELLIESLGLTNRVVEQALAGSKLNQMGFHFAGGLVPPIRQLLGRPAESFGVTPLMIFREISN